MNNTKLIQLLKTFTQHEFLEFGKFIHSPFVNESPMMNSFYDFLKNYYPEFVSTEFTKESVYQKLYGDGKYDDKKVRDRLSDMLNLAEKYLAFVDLEQKPFQYKSHTLHQLSRRRLEVHFKKKVKEIQAVLDSKLVKDLDYFHDIHQFERTKSNFFENPELLGKRVSILTQMDTEVELFLKYFVTQMTTYYILMKNLKESFNHNFDYQFYDQVMNFVEKKNFEDDLLLKFCSLTLRLMENSDDLDLYFKLKKLFIESSGTLGVMHKEIVGSVLYNVALSNFMNEVKGFAREQFEMLKLLYDHEAYPLENGWMSREAYCNGVIVSIINNQLDWAENFVKYYTLKVRPDHREDARLFGISLIQFSRKQYDQALDSLSKIRGKDYIYYLLINTLRSKIYFEQEEYEKLFTLITSYKSFLKSNTTIQTDFKIRYTNYLNALQDLTKICTSVDVDDYRLLQLENEIKNFSYSEITPNKIWLLEKVAQLKS